MSTIHELPTRPARTAEQLDEELRRLSHELSLRHPQVPEDTVHTMVTVAASEYSDARITDYVPVLIRQQVDRHLRSLTTPLAS